MSVLDIGSGVGPRGLVLGLDRDDVSLQRARERTVHHGCSSWVSFETTTLDDFSITRQFDAIVGRYVLLYQPDFTCPTPTTPACDFLDQVLWLVPQAFRLASIFLGANLPFPTVAAEIPVGGASGSASYSWIASTVISLAPRFESLATGSRLMVSIQYGAWTRKSIYQ
jgi:hypothetical protein